MRSPIHVSPTGVLSLSACCQITLDLFELSDFLAVRRDFPTALPVLAALARERLELRSDGERRAIRRLCDLMTVALLARDRRKARAVERWLRRFRRRFPAV